MTMGVDLRLRQRTKGGTSEGKGGTWWEGVIRCFMVLNYILFLVCVLSIFFSFRVGLGGYDGGVAGCIWVGNIMRG